MGFIPLAGNFGIASQLKTVQNKRDRLISKGLAKWAGQEE
jgi:hypothetical protein